MPDAPSNVKAVSSDRHSVLVSWLPPIKPNGQLTHYSVFMKTMESGRQFTQHYETPSTDQAFLVRGLNPNQPYSFWVTASTRAGQGPESTIVAETPNEPSPAAVSSFSRTVLAAVKESVRLECRAVGTPEPTLKWERNLFPVTNREERVRIDAGGRFLTVTSLTMSDSGNFSCVAQNHFGIDQITYNLVVKRKLLY